MSEPCSPSPPWSASTKLAVGAGLGLALIAGVWVARSALGLVAVAGLLAFLLAPAIRWTQQRLRVPRGLAILLVYLVAIVAMAVVGLIVVAATVSSIRQMDLPGMAQSVSEWLMRISEEYRVVTILGFSVDLSGIMDPLREFLTGGVSGDGGGGGFGVAPDQAIEVVLQLIGGAYFVVALVVGTVMSAVITLLVALYLNADSGRFATAAMSMVPETYLDDARRLAGRTKAIWSGYLYGQLVNSLITGFLVFVVLALIGLPGAFLMGLIMALLNMIPTFGPIIAAVPGILSALVGGSLRLEMSNVAFALLVTAIYVVVVQLQANVIAPKVMGTAVQVRPVTVIVALIVGVGVAGLLGALLAVPVVATAKTYFLYLYDKLLDRDPFERGYLHRT